MNDNAAAFAAALEEARNGLSFKRLERLLWSRLGEYAPTYETLRRYHRGEVDPIKADMVIVLAIAQVYGVAASSLSPIIAKRLEETRLLVEQSGCIRHFANQPQLLRTA